MNQILTLLPLLFSNLAGKEKDFIKSQGKIYLGFENKRLGNPLTDAQIEAMLDGLATLIIAEEKALVDLATKKAS